MRRYTLLCEDRQAREIEGLAREYGLSKQEVLRQLLDAGLEHLERGNGSAVNRQGH